VQEMQKEIHGLRILWIPQTIRGARVMDLGAIGKATEV